jgi:ATP-dependent helicase/DNAse subunit B
MPAGHSLYLGSFHALEDALARWLATAREDPLDPAVGIVRSNALARRLGTRLLPGGGAHANLHLLTFLDLAAELHFESGAGAGGPVGEIERGLLVQDLLAASSDPAWRDGARRPGFVAAASATLRDLREARVAPPPKERALAALHDAYGKALEEQGLTDREGLLEASAARVEGSRFLRGVSTVFLYGFYDLTPLQRAVVEALARRGPLAVFVPWGEGEAFRYGAQTLAWLRELLAVDGERLQPDAAHLPGAIAARLFALPEEREPSPEELDAVRVVTAPGPEREAEAVARALVEEREAGTEWSEMAVLLRSGEELREPLRRALASYRVPHRILLPSPLTGEPVAGAFDALLLCLEEGFPWQPASRLLGSPYLKVRSEEAQPALWPALIVESGIVGGGDDPVRGWEERLGRLERAAAYRRERQEERDEPNEAEIRSLREQEEQAGILRSVGGALLRSAAALPSSGSPRELSEELLEFFQKWFRVPPPGGGEVDRNGDPLPEVRERIDREIEAYRAVLDLLRLMAGASRIRGRMTLAELAAETRLALESASFHPRRAPAGAVQVLDVMGARGLSFEVVVLAGMNEKAFPRGVRQDPLLSDTLRERLGMPEKLRGHEEERLLFALALASARGRAILTTQRSDRSGRERTPSPFLREVWKALYGRLVYEPEKLLARLEKDEVRSSASVSLLREAMDDPGRSRPSDLRVATLQKAFGRRARAGHAALGDDVLRRALVAEEMRASRDLTGYDGLVEVGEDVRLEGAGVLSPTRLEDYGKCPFRYFASHVLGLDAPASHPGFEEMSPLDRGSLYHDVLELGYRRLQEEGLLPVTEENREAAGEAMLAVAAERLALWEENGPVPPPLLWEGIRRELLADLEAILDWEIGQEGWTPAHFEASFGKGLPGEEAELSSEEPLVLHLPSGREIRFRGRIDRVDVNAEEGTARILDYKTGKRPREKKVDPWKKDSYQLPLYQRAARELLLEGIGADEVTEAALLFVRHGPEPQFLGEVDENRLLSTIETFADGVAEGRYFLNPDGPCSWCDFQAICRREPVWRSMGKLERDDAARAYREAKWGER